MTMVRKQVYIALDQDRFLKRRARELGVTEADLIRRGLELLAREPVEPWLDSEAERQERKFRAERAVGRPTQRSDWKFNREEIYEERIGRFSG